MWKIAVGFIIFAGLALFILSKGGDINMGGETHGIEVSHEPAPAAAPTSAPAAAAPAPTEAAPAPVAAEVVPAPAK